MLIFTAVDSSNKWTALHIAARHGHERVIQLLIEAGATVNAKSVIGATPLHKAACGGHTEVVRALLTSCACGSIAGRSWRAFLLV